MLTGSTVVVDLFQVKYHPDILLLQWLGIAVVVDFLSAFYRAICLEETKDSRNIRRTVHEVVGYIGYILVVVIVENVFNISKGGPIQESLTHYFNNVFILLMVYAELLRVIENIIMVNKKDLFTIYVMIPIYRILTAQFRGNIINKIDNGNEKEHENTNN